MNYTINIGDEIAKLYGSGKNLVDNQGNWLWDRVLKDTPFPDTIRNITAEYLEAYFQKFDSVPNVVFVEENNTKFTAVDNGNSFVWTKDNKVAPITAKLPPVQTFTPTHTPSRVKKIAVNNRIPTNHEYRKEVRQGHGISVLNPIYFPYVFAFRHQVLWGLWVITKLLGLFTLKVAKASLQVGWVSVYWTFKLMWMIAKYGLIVSAMTIPVLLKIIMVCFTFGLISPRKKKRKRR